MNQFFYNIAYRHKFIKTVLGVPETVFYLKTMRKMMWQKQSKNISRLNLFCTEAKNK